MLSFFSTDSNDSEHNPTPAINEKLMSASNEKQEKIITSANVEVRNILC